MIFLIVYVFILNWKGPILSVWNSCFKTGSYGT